MVEISNISQQYPVKARIGEYNITKKLGAGFSATIRLAHKDDGTCYALKIFDLRKEGNDDKFLKQDSEVLIAINSQGLYVIDPVNVVSHQLNVVFTIVVMVMVMIRWSMPNGKY